MIEAVISGLIYLCILVICVYLIEFVLGALGISIPANIMKIIWVIVILVAILILVRTILPGMGIRLGKVVHTCPDGYIEYCQPLQKTNVVSNYRR